MPSHHHPRRRSNKDSDDLSVRAEESHAGPYSRLSNDSRQTSNYRRTDSTSNSGRSSYDMNRASSSSRAHRETSWRPKDTENRYGDDYYRRRGEEHDVAKSREPESWPAQTVPEPRYSEREWQGYDTGYSTASYSESSSWAVPASTTVDHRNGHQERWQSHDYRGGHARGSARAPERTQTQVVEQRRDWAQDQRRGKVPDHDKWAGSVWDSARVENRANAWVEPPPRWNAPPEKKTLLDTRAWEPAPTWQPSGSGERQNYRNQNAPRNDYYNIKTSVSGRRGASTPNTNATYRNHNHTNNKPQRDWRNDDGNPNNWNRRESQGSERALESSSSTRKHLRSPTRSRSGSRSPAESYYSRRSSRGRTRSPSVSPASKRRRRDPSPIAPSPIAGPLHDGSHAVWVPRQNHGSLPPESGTHKYIDPRNGSPTPSRSVGQSPSRSHSPNPELHHSYHPLPSSVSAPAIVSSPRTGGDDMSHDYAPRRNGGTHAANGAHNNRGRNQPLAQTASVDIMPPPSIIPANLYRPTYDSSPSAALPKLPLASMVPTRIVPKATGFKPIGLNSSSLKKFFPGDEEDMDISSDMSVVADPEPTPQSAIDHTPEPQAEKSNTPIPPQSTEDEQPLPRLPSSPLAPSRGSSVVMEEEMPESSLPRESSPVPPSAQPPLDTTDTGASTPSVQTRSELYAIVSQVGEGTFGKVYKAQNTVTKLHVALKRIRMESEKEGFPVTAMREIKLLQSLRHENVVRLYEMMVSNGSVYMVFEYMDHDLTGILSQTQFIFTDAHLKSLSHQMLAGLAYLHHKGVIHRDIKGSNILINNRGELKLADFGLARFYQKRRRTDYTNRVITLWYRPPELLFGATIYGPEVDMWSAGCIMLELFTKKPVFQGNDEIHQLDTIYRVIGTPTADRWGDVANLPWYELVKPREETPNHFREMFRKWMSPAALDLAERLLCYDPTARATAVQAMEAPYFTQEEPPASAPVGLVTLRGEWHELETKRERAKKRRRNETAIQ